MPNTFTEYRIPKRSLVVNEPWEREITIAEPLLDAATGPFFLRSGDVLEIHCANGSAKYQLLRRHENDIDAGVYRARLIDGVWSLAEMP